MNLKNKILQLTKEKKGLLATNFYNLETLNGILAAASESNEPIILQLTKSSIDYIGLETAVQMARTKLKEFNVEGWIHLDHGGTVELVQKCLDVGFDSVMIDGSELPFEENIKITQEVVKRAEKYGTHVEAELGYVAKLNQSHTKQLFTQPQEAKAFIDNTGVDALAIAIGTAHGFYKEQPNLDIDLLKKIANVSSASLVLHGSSGVPSSQIQDAISNGICKINLATEIKNVFMKQLQLELANTSEIDLRKVFPKATKAITSLVRNKLLMIKNNTYATPIH